MAVAAVIPCRDEASTVGRLLDALIAQRRPPDEIVVVDDRSRDATPRVLADWQRSHPGIACRIVSGPGRGVAAAVNAGIAATAAEVIVRLDGHSVPDPAYVERVLDALNESRAGVVGGVWTIEPGAPTTVAAAIARVVAHPVGSGGAQYRHADTAPDHAIDVETVPFGAFPRRVWEQLGGFDERLLANEDYDFNYRVRATGARVLLDGRIRSTYRARPTLLTLARQYHRYGFWKAKMLTKDPRAIHLRQVAAAAILPWCACTAVLAVAAPGLPSIALAAAYPTAVLAAAMTIGARGRSVALGCAAVLAILTCHVSWSAGFLRAWLPLGSPDGPKV